MSTTAARPEVARASYVAADAASTVETDRLQKRSLADVRVRIRSLSSVPEPFSADWSRTAEVVRSLAASVATSSPAGTGGAAEASPTSPSSIATSVPLGSAGSGSQTIWERGDVCVRIIVEEGRSSLFLRLLTHFIETLYSTGVPVLESQNPVEMQQLTSEIQQYVADLHRLLSLLVDAVEVVQTLDYRTFVDYAKLVLTVGAKPGLVATTSVTGQPIDDVVRRTCERGVLDALARMLRVMDNAAVGHSIGEYVIESRVLSLIVLVAATQQQEGLPLSATNMTPDTRTAVVTCVARLCDGEVFKTKRDQFFPEGKRDKDLFVVAFDGLAKGEIAAKGPDAKKALRPLTDTVLRFK